jgi:zinc D-Ala-D-Ala dipeptidase
MARDRLHQIAVLFACFAVMMAALALSLAAFASPVHAKELRSAYFVDAKEFVPDLVVEMRYAGNHNFVGGSIDGYERPVCLLTREAARALANIEGDLKARGLGLKVFDCYRPQRAVAHFVRWARDVTDIRAKTEFYPAVDKRYLFQLGYIASMSGHSRGSTVDLTLVRLVDNAELDMGTPFDFFSPKSWPSDQNVSSEARANRRVLAAAMSARGFRSYSKEWWHFTLRGEPYPNSYFDFPVR